MQTVQKFQMPQAGLWRVITMFASHVCVMAKKDLQVVNTWWEPAGGSTPANRHFYCATENEEVDDAFTFVVSAQDTSGNVLHIWEDTANIDEDPVEGRDYG